MKLLVTGAGGFVGAAVCHSAVEEGLDVVALARAERPERLTSIAQRVVHERIDMADAEGLRAVLLRERPDVVVHSAWAGVTGDTRQQRSQISENIDASCRLVEFAAEANVSKFIGIGSQAEYGPLNRRVSERDLPEPVTLYGAAKLATLHLTRQLCSSAGMSFAWARLFAAYGPGDNSNWMIPSLILKMARGERPKVSLGTQLWDYLYIDDAAAGVLALATSREAAGTFNLASGVGVPVRAIVENLRDRLAADMQLVFGEIPFGPNQIMHLEGDVAKLQNETGWRPKMALDEGLQRTIEAFVGGR